MNAKVDFYFADDRKWHKELLLLREIVNSCGVIEELKWGVPCYTFNNANVVLIHVFKEYCALLFIKGALLSDPEKILVQQTENVQAGRQLRFTSASAIKALQQVIKSYIYEAIEVERAGLKVPYKSPGEFSIAAEFEAKLHDNTNLKIAFDALTPGRQRAYLLHFSSPKQSKTREARVEKCIPQIMAGKGLNE